MALPVGLDYRIDHEQRLVRVTASGVITADTLFEYQKEAWSDPAIAEYDELVDMGGVEDVEASSPSNVSALAGFSAKMDARRSRPSSPSSSPTICSSVSGGCIRRIAR